MELLFLLILVLLMAVALGSGYPVAFALPGCSIITIALAALCGYLFSGDPSAYFAQGGPWQWLSAGVTNLRGVYWEPERDTLIAIPLFIFMGIMLQRSKIAEDLLITMAQLFGPVPGGLGISVVFVGALLAATTGIVGATVVAMGLISLPAMLRNNYSQSLATGTIAASGTLGQIIPPSIVLIILADQLSSAADQAGTARKALFSESTGELSMPSIFDVGSTSAGEMFLGAFLPGLVLVALYMIYILVYAFIKPDKAPPVPYEGKYDRAFMMKVFLTLFPPLALIFLVLGSIIAGIATVNQAGAIGAGGALIMAGYRLKEGEKRAYWPALLAIASLIAIAFVLALFNTNVKAIHTDSDRFGVALAVVAVIGLSISLIWSGWRALRIEDTLRGVMIETAKTTSLVFIILLGAAILTAAFRAFGGEHLVKEFLNGLPGGFWTKFIIVMAVIFILGFFLDFIEIAVVVVPIVAPILLADPGANITAVWLGVMIGLNIQTSFLTPPFGFALFYLRGVAPATVKTLQMYKGVIVFIGLQLTALAIVGAVPQLVNYLPNRVAFLSDTAPPPRNPRLSYCIDRYVTEEITRNGDAIAQAVIDAKAINLDILPRKIAADAIKSFDNVDKAIENLKEANLAEQRIDEASEGYRPLHSQVRAIEADIRKLRNEADELNVLIGRLNDPSELNDRKALEARVEKLNAEMNALQQTIPSGWEAAYAKFNELNKAESDLRRAYTRASAQAYEPIGELLAVIDGSEAFRTLEADLRAIRGRLDAATPEQFEELVDVIQDMERNVRAVEGTSDIRSALSKARRAIRSRNPDQEKALAEYGKALALYTDQLDWRAKAEAEIAPALRTYEAAVRDTIGIRQQPKMTREQALFVAGCASDHRDISLHF